MSGHSKWSTIKHKKAAQDAKRGKIFTKLGRVITVAAREGGGDMDTNFVLRLAVEKARKSSMPSDNIDRAIKRGTGESGDGIVMTKAVYGGYGPGGVAVAIDVLTDNKNRTVSTLRKIFEDHGGTLSEASSVLWQFKSKGRVVIKCVRIEASKKFGEDDKEIPIQRDEMMMSLMDVAGVEDVQAVEDIAGADDIGDLDESGGTFKLCEVITSVKNLAKIRGEVEKLGYIVDSAEIVKVPENMQDVDESTAEKLRGLFGDLDENDDVEGIWFNSDV